MRELKFRAWDVTHKCMCSPGAITTEEGAFLEHVAGLEFDEPRGEVILMQYTGLHDDTKWEELTKEEWLEWLKHNTKGEWKGRRIYEGDIVKIVDEDEDERSRGAVEWLNDHGFYNVTKEEDCLFDLSKEYTILIIGNIYENPKLI